MRIWTNLAPDLQKPWTARDAHGFSFAATYWPAYRTFRLLRSLPLDVEFFTLHYRLELYSEPGTAQSLHVRAMLSWNDIRAARQICHVPRVRELYVTGYDVDCGSLAEVLFLRLVRQGDAEELAGPHCRISSCHVNYPHR